MPSKVRLSGQDVLTHLLASVEARGPLQLCTTGDTHLKGLYVAQRRPLTRHRCLRSLVRLEHLHPGTAKQVLVWYRLPIWCIASTHSLLAAEGQA